ncbi:MAG TPA: hypothetical protein VFW33_01620 [Gemmataceae bacterium]|nr:hypothetical protein [Gemmataceae bacterium]
MSTNPGKPGPPAATDATGVFSPEGQSAGDATAALPPAGAPFPDATGVFVPEEPPSPAGEATEATGMFVPGAAAPDAGEATAGGTGVYEPAPTRPAEAAGGATNPAAAGATGAYAPERGPAALAQSTLPPRQGKPTSAAPSQRPLGPPPAPVRRCGRYVLKKFHAKGGMGEIWVAEDPDIGRSVALKRMLGRRKDAQTRFVVEAQITGQLEHPGIVPVHELGTTPDGQPYYVMKFVRGRTLKKIIQEYHEAL